MKDAPTPAPNPTATFFCTRCRRRVSFPSERRDQIVFCPFCQQALIVPNLSLNVPDSFDLDSATRDLRTARPDAPIVSAPRSEFAAPFAPNGGPAIASHLLPPNERVAAARRRTVADPETDFDLALPGASESEFADEPVSTLDAPKISDADFIARMTAAPIVPDASNPTAPPPVVRPPRPRASDSAKPTPSGDVPRFRLPLGLRIGFGVVALVAALVAATAFVPLDSDRSDSNPPPRNAEIPGFVVDGEATYRTASGGLEGDEGAFVFIFPADEPFERPLSFFGANPTLPLPTRFDEFRDALKESGGYFAQAESDGGFLFRIARPGEYRVLAVSKRVLPISSEIAPRTLEEIGEYLSLPDKTLLTRTRFDWSLRTLTPEDPRVEIYFGKVADR